MTDRGVIRLEATVVGRVQGVGFRWFVVEAAGRLGLHGWVANQADGSVACVAEGPGADLEALLAELHRGPAAAEVRRVNARWLPSSGGLRGFAIRSGAHPGD